LNGAGGKKFNVKLEGS